MPLMKRRLPHLYHRVARMLSHLLDQLPEAPPEVPPEAPCDQNCVSYAGRERMKVRGPVPIATATSTRGQAMLLAGLRVDASHGGAAGVPWCVPPSGSACASARWRGVVMGCLLMVVVACSGALGGCSSAPHPGEEPTMRACRICHGGDRMCANLGKLDKAGWEQIVDRMVAGGAYLTATERPAVVDWLVTRKAGDKLLCQ